jgi:hypothetical protein
MQIIEKIFVNAEKSFMGSAIEQVIKWKSSKNIKSSEKD